MTFDLRKNIHRNVTSTVLSNYLNKPIHINVADDGTYESSTLCNGKGAVDKPAWSEVSDKIISKITENEYRPVRKTRDRLLQECDWTVGIDSPLSDDKKEEWKTYRQALRDLPSTLTDVEKVFWPVKPGG